MNEITFPAQDVRPVIARHDPTDTPPAKEGGQPLLTRYLTIANRSKWLILGAIITALVIGVIVTLLTTPQYTAATRLEINRTGTRIVNVEEVQPDSNVGDMEFYQTQYGILESRSLAERVARDLRLSENARFFEMFGEDEAVEALRTGRAPTPETNRDGRMRLAAEVLLKNLDVAPIRLSRLVDVRWTSPDPALSAQVANAWATGFVQYNLERRYEATAYARQFLEQRLNQLRGRLEDSERQLVAYASQQSLINLPAGSTVGPNGTVQTQERSLTADSLTALNTALAEATADRVRAQSRARAASGGSSTEALANSAISGLRERRAEAAAEYSRLMTQFTPEYPPAAALQAQIRQLDQSIAREESRVQNSISNAYQDSVQRETVLTQRVQQLQNDFMDQRRRSIQYNIFQREVDTNRELYNGLLQRYKEIGVAGGVGENNVLVVDAAEVPERPSRPRLLLNLLISLIAGIGLGAALAFVRDHIDDAINDPSEVETRLGIPLMGTLPKSDGADPLLELRDPKSGLMEAALTVQSNLAFSTDRGFPRTATITSTRPAEGKSTTAQAIAYVVARQGARTLLVDADMRSPSLHHRLKLTNTRGLSNYLAGGETADKLIQKPADEPFHVLTAGPQPPNAAELLRGDGLGKLMAELKEQFDCVIVDSPPVMGLADAPIIGSWVEATIYVVEAHGVRARIVRQALLRLRHGRAKILGCVLTKFEPKRGHFSYGHEYGYGYGYGYGKADNPSS